MNVISSDQELQTLLQKIISAGTVSVFIDPDGIMKEYSVITHDGVLLTCACMRTTNNKNMLAYEYSVSLNENTVSTVIIPAGRTIYLPEEQSILNLIKMCSDKLIWQETKNRLQNIFGGAKTKIYQA